MSDMAEWATYLTLRQMQRDAQIGIIDARVENGIIYVWGLDYAGNIGEGRVVEVAGQAMTVTHVFSPAPGRYRARKLVRWHGAVVPFQQTLPPSGRPCGITIDMTAQPEPTPTPVRNYALLPPSGLHAPSQDRW